MIQIFFLLCIGISIVNGKLLSSDFLQAAIDGNIQDVESWIKSKGDVNVKDKDGYTALHYSVSRDRKEIKRYNDGGGTDMVDDTKGRRIKIVELLIKSGINVNKQDNGGRTALSIAAMKGHFEILKILIRDDVNADVNVQNQAGYTALMYSVYYNFPEIVKLLVNANNIDTEIKNKKGNTAYDIAIIDGHDHQTEIVKALKKYKYKYKYKEFCINGICDEL